MNGFSNKMELRVDWGDIDILGHVNNVAILKYVQTARINFCEQIGLAHSPNCVKTGPILASVSCQFRKPLYYPGKVMIMSRVAEVKNTSFILHHEIYDETGELAAGAEDIIVLYDFLSNTKLAIPDELRLKMGGGERNGK